MNSLRTSSVQEKPCTIRDITPRLFHDSSCSYMRPNLNSWYQRYIIGFSDDSLPNAGIKRAKYFDLSQKRHYRDHTAFSHVNFVFTIMFRHLARHYIHTERCFNNRTKPYHFKFVTIYQCVFFANRSNRCCRIPEIFGLLNYYYI